MRPLPAVFKGNVWSFTVEPYAYPITGVTATASSNQPSMGPEKTVDGSGMTGDLHGVESTTMWMSKGTPLPNWIQYEFDATYKLDKLMVWNSNQMIESFIGFGAKDVTVEYSVDGVTWTTLAGVPQFSQATGTVGYAANTTVDFAGAMAKYVKLTINKSWGGVTATTGLAEVRFSYIPVQARAPQPANAATGVSLNTDLNLAARPRGHVACGQSRHRPATPWPMARRGHTDRAQLYAGRAELRRPPTTGRSMKSAAPAPMPATSGASRPRSMPRSMTSRATMTTTTASMIAGSTA